MNEIDRFEAEKADNIRRMTTAPEIHALSRQCLDTIAPFKYAYNFTWMGRPIIQFPQDMIAMQEIVWQVRPRVIVETGVAHGGSLVYYASLLELLGDDGIVIGVDIDIRLHNRAEIEKHPMAKRIRLVQGSSIDSAVVEKVHQLAAGRGPVVACFDSNHTHEHVLAELRAYSPLVKSGSYLVVMDTVIENMAAGSFPDRPWDVGDNPLTAVRAFLAENDRFEINEQIAGKLLLTVATDGYLRCVKD